MLTCRFASVGALSSREQEARPLDVRVVHSRLAFFR
jgi:hypothetical protein